MSILNQLTRRSFAAKVVKIASGGGNDSVGLSTISEFWFGDKITVWDRHTLLTDRERTLLWMDPTAHFIKSLKDNFEKDLADEKRQTQSSIDNILLFD